MGEKHSVFCIRLENIKNRSKAIEADLKITRENGFKISLAFNCCGFLSYPDISMQHNYLLCIVTI
jgi:hypothetical protein